MARIDNVPTRAAGGVRIVIVHPGMELGRQHQAVPSPVAIEQLS
jgi:hypothetical protein